MTPISDTGFAQLESEGRLLNPVFKGPTHVPGRFGFRGELALKFASKQADEARPPELMCQQVLAIAERQPTIPFFAGYLLSFAELKPLAEALGKTISAGGKYFVFCNNIDLGSRYQVPYAGAMWYVLPIDEATVWNEMLDLVHLDRNDLKKLDTAAKLDRLAQAAIQYDVTFDMMTYAEGLERMGPVRNPNENRPV
ncbi:MAG TPA: hypothetical protein VFQ61_25575 [Polyangiaceae bacterium]|nr:hypothetical protein [Polyangiaceae bacterium]